MTVMAGIVEAIFFGSAYSVVVELFIRCARSSVWINKIITVTEQVVRHAVKIKVTPNSFEVLKTCCMGLGV